MLFQVALQNLISKLFVNVCICQILCYFFLIYSVRFIGNSQSTLLVETGFLHNYLGNFSTQGEKY